ncbi:hypothetical protein KVR01_006001 [Diaporthe batatas]|uniref:uncharacterized protein n=1 Tax=Diaporthe batatas TaxID=748121 RepID=UPI001D03C6FA|nr:uncharacterized protein KVR01_006001 [Diaporthe batatas]KAG8164083.1 hypothetical protein KVR01_006001 [Diaporthe batatas]
MTTTCLKPVLDPQRQFYHCRDFCSSAMGTSDDYCAICGGPFREIYIAEKPRTAAFLKKWARDIEQHRSGDKAAHAKGCIVDEYDEEGDEEERWERFEEEKSYDQDIISVEDVKWAETLHVLALNPNAEGGTYKAFVSGPGTYDEVGGVFVDDGDDPNAEDFDFGRVLCYQNQDDNRDAIFPFHWCCYEMLSKCITGSFEASSFSDDGVLVYSIDNDLLYSIMQELLRNFGYKSFSNIDYGEARRMQEQTWEIEPGYEFLVRHPLDVPGANEAVLSVFSSDAFKSRSPCSDFGSRVRRDPFLRVPYDIVHRISGLVSNEDLINLARASWPIHCLLHNNDQFWRQRIGASFLPWFLEFGALLEQDETLLQSNNPQRIFQWLERSTRSDRWLTGPLMGVVNRRRIWSACEQFSQLYREHKELQNDASISDEERLIRKYSKSVHPTVVASPKATILGPTRKVFWAKTWPELRSQEKTLETFWDRRGSLVGISLTPDGQRRRLLGMSDLDDDVSRESMRLGAEEWIKGLVIHLPIPTYLDDNRLETSPKGLTVLLDSGRTSVMGSTSECQMQQLLSSAPDWCITGIHGNTGVVRGNLQLIRIGLVQAQPSELQVVDYSTPPHRLRHPHRGSLEELTWDDDYSQILGRRIQEYQGLQLTDHRNYHHSGRGYLANDLVSCGALIWAKNAGEHRSLRRLTGCIVSARDQSGPVRACLSGLSAEHEPATDMRRMVGVNQPDGIFESFDIDGPGGEVVTELEVPAEQYTRALKIHTSLGRTHSWGEKGAHAFSYGRTIEARPGETLVGIVVKFGGLDQLRDDVDEALGHNVMTVVGGLSMQLEASL